MTNAIEKVNDSDKYLGQLAQIQQLAQVCAKSGLFGQTDAAQMTVLMMVAQSRGIPLIEAGLRFHIVKGRPVMKAEAMLMEWQRCGGIVRWLEHSRTIVVGVYTHPEFAPDGFKQATRIEDFKFLGGDQWRNYPEQMLHARNVSQAIRTLAPIIVSGMYTPEEVRDFDEPKRTATVETASLAVAIPREEWEANGATVIDINPPDGAEDPGPSLNPSELPAMVRESIDKILNTESVGATREDKIAFMALVDSVLPHAKNSDFEALETKVLELGFAPDGVIMKKLTAAKKASV